jgi:hypothetical protein
LEYELARRPSWNPIRSPREEERIYEGCRSIRVRPVVGTASLSAHHSLAAEYDSNKPVTLSGVVASG